MWRLKQYQAFFLDVDGVLVRDGRPVDEAVAAFRLLQASGPVLVLTNNSTRSRQEHAETLSRLGFPLLPAQIISSAYVAATHLLASQGRQPVWPVGERGLAEELAACGHCVVDLPEQAAWVVAGMDRAITYEKLGHALHALERGARLMATNEDGTYPTPRGRQPGAGAVIGALRGMGFEPDVVIGKPEPALFRRALDMVQAPGHQVLMIGDRLETDILGAQRCGIHSLLVLSGISNREAVARTKTFPTWIASSLGSILDGSVEPGHTALLPQDSTSDT